jgi:hypothetical protein
MKIQFISDFLLLCLAINYFIITLVFFSSVFARGWMFRLHTRWFHLSEENFDSVHYAGMAAYKIGILLFNLIPYVALRTLISHGS